MKASVIAVVLAVLAAVSIAQTNCQPEIEFSDGNKYKFDLTGLWHKAGDKDTLQCRDDDYNTYYMNICGEVSEHSQSECSGASVCQETLSGNYNNAGTLASQTFQPNPNTEAGKGLVVVYGDGKQCSSGDKRTTSIYIECDPQVEEPIIQPATADYCKYTVRMTSKYGCGKSAGAGGGDTAAIVILLILICGLVLYFALGVVYQKFVKHAEAPVEYIIHHEFWCALPTLIKDGILFITHGCKKGDYVSV